MKKVYFLISFMLLIPLTKAVDLLLPAIVTINPIYNLTLDIEILTEKISLGDDITTLVRLNKTGKPGLINVDLNYTISDRQSIIASGTLNPLSISDFIETTINVSTPSTIKTGKYFLKITASHPQTVGSPDVDNFVIQNKGKGKPAFLEFKSSPLSYLTSIFRIF